MSNNTEAASVSVNPQIGVPVRGWIAPIQVGARPSRARMTPSRDGTSIVEFIEVVIAITAPKVTNHAAPAGKYAAATSAIGVVLAPSRTPGSTPNETAVINMKITAVRPRPFR